MRLNDKESRKTVDTILASDVKLNHLDMRNRTGIKMIIIIKTTLVNQK